jgi:hypothetical protein
VLAFSGHFTLADDRPLIVDEAIRFLVTLELSFAARYWLYLFRDIAFAASFSRLMTLTREDFILIRHFCFNILPFEPVISHILTPLA